MHNFYKSSRRQTDHAYRLLHLTCIGPKLNYILVHGIKWFKKKTRTLMSGSVASLYIHNSYIGQHADRVKQRDILQTQTGLDGPCVAQWLERPLGVREAGVRFPTASHQRRKKLGGLRFSG